MRRKNAGDLCRLVLTSVFWGATFPIGRVIVQTMEPLTAAFFRYAAASLLFAGALLYGGNLFRQMNRKVVILWLLLGITGIFGYNYFFFTGLKLASASEGSIIIPLLNPILVAVMAALFLGEPLGRKLWIGGSFAALGTSLIVLTPIFRTGQDLHFKGDLLFLGASLSWGLYTVLGKIALKDSSPIEVTGHGILFGTLLLTPFAWKDIVINDAWNADAGVWAGLLFMAYLATFLGFTWYYRGVRALGAAKAAVYIYLVPVTGLLISSLWLGERLLPAQWIGALLVGAGVIVASGE